MYLKSFKFTKKSREHHPNHPPPPNLPPIYFYICACNVQFQCKHILRYCPFPPKSDNNLSEEISIITECFSSRELSFMPWLGSLNLLKWFATIYSVYITTKDVSTISYHSLNRQNIQNKSTKSILFTILIYKYFECSEVGFTKISGYLSDDIF